jgi:hypothetical protein
LGGSSKPRRSISRSFPALFREKPVLTFPLRAAHRAARRSARERRRLNNATVTGVADRPGRIA